MEILLIAVLIIFNGAFAMSEIAIVSSRRTRLQRWARFGDRRAQAALALRNSPNIFLSTVQIGITLVGVMMGAIGQAAVADDVAATLRRIPALALYADEIALAAVVVGITYVSLIIGELVPKRLALLRPERIARLVAPPMAALARLASPVVRLLSVSVEAVLRLLRVRAPAEPAMTEEEVQAAIEEGMRTGVFLTAERDLLRNVMRLADLPLRSLMTPRDQIDWLDLNDPPDVNKRRLMESKRSRFPVAAGTLDRATTVVQAKDLLTQAYAGEGFSPAAVAKPLQRVRIDASPLRVLELFRLSPLPMVLVVSAGGEVKGLVTLHDLLDAIAGGLPVEGETPEPLIVQREDGSWLLDGSLPVGDLKNLLNLAELPAEAADSYETVGGFVLHQLGRLPRVGERFTWQGHVFEVVDMDNRRIDRVLVTRSPAPH